MISFMQKILSFTFLCLLFFPFFMAHAIGETDLTSQNFVVNLSTMDPLGA
jgi:hypothetical protein